MATKSKKLTELKSLDDQAVTFPIELPLTRLDGSKAQITFTCKALTKRDWTAAKQRRLDVMYAKAKQDADAIRESASQEGDSPDEMPVRINETVEQGIAQNALLVSEFAAGWTLQDDLNTDALEDLEDRFGGSLDRLIVLYDKAIYQGQLGN